MTPTLSAKSIAIAAKIATPCFMLPAHFPKVNVSPAGTTKMASIWSQSVNGAGFSNGWAELALKNPPPLVPSILIASCEATGPTWIACVAPWTVVAFTEPASVWTAP